VRLEDGGEGVGGVLWVCCVLCVCVCVCVLSRIQAYVVVCSRIQGYLAYLDSRVFSRIEAYSGVFSRI